MAGLLESFRETRVVRGACPHDCPDTCSMLTTVVEGRVESVRGDPDHPVTRGFLCAKVNRYPERTESPHRVLHPLIRTGPKASGEFREASWNEALDLIARRLGEAVAAHGPQSVLPYSYSGTLGLVQSASLDRRFFHALGASLLDRTICSEAGFEGYRYTIGASIGTDPEEVHAARLIILWGTNTLTSNPHLWPQVRRAREAGARIVGIDPYRTRTMTQVDEHLAIRPGTDAALALAMMHVIIAEGLVDREYVETATTGFEALAERVRDFDPERAARITGLEAGRIAVLAREYAAARPAFIRINYGLQRHAGGGMAVRTIACLPALCGHWRSAAGGILLSTSGFWKSGKYALNLRAVQRPDLIPAGTRTINMNRLGQALAGGYAGESVRGRELASGPPVSALIVYGSNPAAVAPDQGAVQRGLAREDLFTVVHEIFMTDTARLADVVLPATTQPEQWDLHTAYGQYWLTLNQPAIPTRGGAVSNSELFRRLGRALGLDPALFAPSDCDLIKTLLDTPALREAGVTFERLLEGPVRVAPRPYAPFAAGTFPTPSGKCELYSERMAANGLDPVPGYTPMRESPDTAPELARRFPLNLISPPAHHHLNTSFGGLDSIRRAAGDPTLHLHPADAGPRNLSAGAWARVFNDRGEFLARCVVTDAARPGVVLAPGLWWTQHSPGSGNVNQTTSPAVTDMGGGATFYDCLVEVTPAPEVES
jgi:anaerobic selenocysteine-containing dehydrogenase